MVTGATRAESLPMKAPSSITVGFLVLPSKLHVMVPAPMFTSSPIVASPRYVRWLAFDPRPSVVFFSSTKLPTCAPVEHLAGGPQVRERAAAPPWWPRMDSVMTQ